MLDFFWGAGMLDFNNLCKTAIYWHLSEQSLGCSTDPRSLQEYDGEAHEERCVEGSMQDQVIGRYCEYHMLLE